MISGSPPHVRGKAGGAAVCERELGITPACAGKSAAIPVTRRCGRDHPCVCGEKFISGIWLKCLSGSPPRMRGKVLQLVIGHAVEGITPAYAGKRHGWAKAKTTKRDHPRVCGEKTSTFCGLWFSGGSPPRMRGKGNPSRKACVRKGITPAYAGKRWTTMVSGSYSRDHPRTCGEKHLLRLLLLSSSRITPAHAGKSGRKCKLKASG